jgi:pyrimidine-specific ribonucleoside hydrolase
LRRGDTPQYFRDFIQYFLILDILDMQKTIHILLFWVLIFTESLAQNPSKQAPVNLIFDSDIGPDYDDVGAMAIMHALADSGQVKILATMACNKSKYIAGVMSVINTYFNRPNIPIGVVRGNAVNMVSWQKWDSILVAKFPSKIKNNNQAEDALKLYRRILSQQADNSVTIVTVGFLTNLANVLQSKPDKISPLSGTDLVKRKVKRLVTMGGRFPKGNEYNIQCDPISAKYVFENWTSEIIFSGWEIGNPIHTGLPLIQQDKIQHSPIKEAFAVAIPQAKEDASGRMSWDETAVLVGIKGHNDYYSLVEGRFICKEWGGNEWDSQGKGHFYLVEKMPISQMEMVLNTLIMHKPKQQLKVKN